ncbi:hypothetical protein E3U43_016055 [Larimichthys crocea]|uniref:Uncharacterized protein n=1 Tax=Larimichthys crocea TaxID=215358 RepID=A0ACD3QGF5_LARCR|nr:hypothetical protein E3U43_016055 [Larimichthys crocea]
MGAKFTICCCRYYLKHNKEEKNAILRMRTTTASKQPELLSSESSDSDTEKESLFGPQPSRKSPWSKELSQRNPVDLWTTVNRPNESPYQARIGQRVAGFY